MGKPLIETRYSIEGVSYKFDTAKQRNFGYIKVLKQQLFKTVPSITVKS